MKTPDNQDTAPKTSNVLKRPASYTPSPEQLKALLAAQPLNNNSVQQLAGAVAKHAELTANKILTPEIVQEKTVLEGFIAETLCGHAREFVGAWFLAQEYRGLVGAFTNLTARAQSAIEFNKQPQKKAELAEADSGGSTEKE